jgi:hypothetical protein
MKADILGFGTLEHKNKKSTFYRKIKLAFVQYQSAKMDKILFLQTVKVGYNHMGSI